MESRIIRDSSFIRVLSVAVFGSQCQVEPVGADRRDAQLEQRREHVGPLLVPAYYAEPGGAHACQPLRRQQLMWRRVALPAWMHVARAAAARERERITLNPPNSTAVGIPGARSTARATHAGSNEASTL